MGEHEGEYKDREAGTPQLLRKEQYFSVSDHCPFPEVFGQRRHNLQEITYYAVCRHLENRRVRVLIYRHYGL